jgi:hypothetical protein
MDSEAVTLPNLGKLVEWTAKHAEGEPRSEVEIANALWDFIREADASMSDIWDDKAYDLEAARRELSRWLG